MKQYKVRVVRAASEYAELSVWAESLDAAADEAVDIAITDRGIDWELGNERGCPWALFEESEEIPE